MTLVEARKILSNKKVFVKNKGKEIQEKLFNIGFKWVAPEEKGIYKDRYFLFLYEDLTLTYVDVDDIEYFYEHRFKEISAEDILNIKIEEPLPKTWEEYYKQVNRKFHDNTIQKSYHQYEAHRQLLHLRDCYRNGWKPKDGELRWIITPIDSGFYIASYYNINGFLSFQSEEIAEEFLKNFKDLIIQAGGLYLVLCS